MNKKRAHERIVQKVFGLRHILACVLLSMIWGTAYSQSLEKKVSINVKNELIRPVLDELEKKGEITFVYDEKLLSTTKRVSLDFTDTALRLVLDELCRQIAVRYELEKNLVLLMPERRQPITPSSTIIRGYVRDENKEPLPGVTVILKGTGVGTTTTANGFYLINLPKMEDITLVFSFVGMEIQEVKYTGQDSINVVMKEDVKRMDEVVVTGYQTVKKRSMAGSTSHVKSEDLVLTGTQSLEQALQGKIPGMTVINTSGLTGTRQRVRVRGTSTLLGSAEPVWVVDGVIQEDPLPFETNDLTNLNPDNEDMIKDFIGGAISWLNPNDIEDITVLKDASSTAIYGVKAANGVIVITTKKGEKGRLSLNYSGSLTFTPRLNYNRMELMNSQERVDVSREAYERGLVLGRNETIGYLGAALQFERGEISYDEFNRLAREYETNNTDWFDLLFRNAFSHSHSISISGGSENVSYRASFGINDVKNTAKGNAQRQYTGNLNMSAMMWKCVTFNVGLSGSVSETSAFAGSDPFKYASTMSRAIPAFDENGDYAFYQLSSNGLDFNVMNELENSGNENTQSSLNATFSLRWNILDGLAFNTTLSYSYSATYGETWYSEKTNRIAAIRGYNFEEYAEGSTEYSESFLPVGGELSEVRNNSNNWSWRNQLEYNKVFNDVHSFTAMLGQEMRSSKVSAYSMTTYGYMPEMGKIFVVLPDPVKIGSTTYRNTYLNVRPTITDTKNNYLSFYTALSYMYDDRYAINLSVRSDASNQFGQDKSTRFLPVWAVGFRWNVGSEHWLAGQNILSDMNIRFTYGFQGNVASTVSPYLVANIVANTTGGYALEVNQLPAPKLKWEKVQSINIGTDFSLFNNHILGSFEWYTKKTTDMVVNQEIPMENGVLSRPINGGEMKNSGWDASISFTPLRTKDWVLSLGFNFGQVNNEINSTLDPEGSWQEAAMGNLNKEGYAVGSFWAFRFTGLNPEHGGPEFDLTGMERDGAGSDATMYMEYAGKMEPDFTSGVSFTLRYKTWSLTSGLYLSTGNQTFLAPMASFYEYIPSEEQNMSTEWVNRWRKPGDEKHTNVPSLPNIVDSAQPINFTSEVKNSQGLTNSYKPYELYAYSNARVVDAWYLRCNNIRLNYTVPTERLPKFLQNLSFSFSMSNPFQIRSNDFKGRDPEVALGNQPMSHDYAFSVNLSF